MRDALSFLGLDEVASKLVRQYSGGMIRRWRRPIHLHRPAVRFLDEQTVGMDPIARQAVWEYLKQLHDTYGMTIFLTTHYMEEADHLCDRVAIMHANKLAALGTPGELKSAVGGDKTTLDDVFIHYSAGVLEAGDDYSEASRERLTTSALG